MRHFLAIVDPEATSARLSEAELASVVALFDGIDLRLPAPLAGSMRLFDAATALRKDKRAHFWSGKRHPGSVLPTELRGTACPDDAEAVAEARRAAEWVTRFDLTTLSVNAERDVWRGPRLTQAGRATYAPNPGAAPFLKKLVQELRNRSRASLRYLGFPRPDKHYPGAVFPDEVKEQFDGLSSMAYSSSESTLRQTLTRNHGAWRSAVRSFGAYAGVGRIDKGGKVVGNAAAWRNFVTQRPGEIEEITWYVANEDAVPQILQGHPRHPPLVTLIPELRHLVDQGAR